MLDNWRINRGGLAHAIAIPKKSDIPMTEERPFWLYFF